MFKVGDEVLVKSKVVNVSDDNDVRIQIEGWGSCWFRNDSVIPAGKTYADGLSDAWELAKKIVVSKEKGGYSATEVCEIFGMPAFQIFERFTPEEALSKIEAYEREKEIKVGDVVYGDDDPESFGVVTLIDSFGTYVMWVDGSSGRDKKTESLHKTGKHIDIEGLLLRLPFLPKPGMKIYDIYGVIENGEAEPREITVRSFDITHARMWYFHINNEVFMFDDFGKTYFLTREEAEATLAEKGGV